MCTGLLLICQMYSVYCYLNHQSFALVEESWNGSADQKMKRFVFKNHQLQKFVIWMKLLLNLFLSPNTGLVCIF